MRDIFRALQEHSKFEKGVWESQLSNGEFPTPYAYLLYQIAWDFEDLSSKALRKQTSNRTEEGPRKAAAPNRIAKDLAMNWSLIVGSIADSQKQVGAQFRKAIIREYLAFILKLGWGPSEIYVSTGNGVDGLNVWRDLFTSELKNRFLTGDSGKKATLEEVFGSMDFGKSYVMAGYDWLKKELFGEES